MRKTGTPLTESKRLEWIDAARGFAILGIFMVNVPAFSAPFFLYGGEETYWYSQVDHTIQIIIDIFFQASFYTLFSFLFGFGIQIMIDNLMQKQQLEVNKVIRRRLLILIGFGLIHAFLIWHGDILLSYGIIGFLLFCFMTRKDKTLLRWAFALLIIPTVLYTGLLYMVRDQLGSIDYPAVQLAFENYGNGTFMDIIQQNYHDWAYGGIVSTYIFLVISLLPLFLLGMVVARKRWLHQVDEHKNLLRKFWFITMVLFIVVKAGPHLVDNPSWMSFFQDSIGGTASALFYVLSITLAYQKNRLTWLLKPLTSVGKMSLTNYIFQSLVCFLLFYSVGFGLYGEISPLGSVGIVIIIFSFQVIVSNIWLRKFRFGPLEWLWRSLTYQQQQPWKRIKRKEEA